MKNKLLLIVKILVSGGVIYYLFKQICFQKLLHTYLNINLLILIITIIILFLQSSLSSLKWKYILTSDNIYAPYLFLLKSYFIGSFISLFLPTSFGGDLYRVYSLKRYNLDALQNASSVLFDRICGLFALASISIISYTFFYKHIIDYRFLGIYFFGIILFLIFSSERVLDFLDTIKLKILSFFLSILRSFNQYRSRKKTLLKSLVISFVFQNNIIWVVKLYCVALNIGIDIKYLYMFVPLIWLTETLPISINGLGVREGAFVFFFVQAGYTKEEALAVALLVIAMRYLFFMTIGGSLFFKAMLFPDKKK